ncbi:MAG: hypothetical protein ACOY0T_20810 [Myxococcota bacterium]
MNACRFRVGSCRVVLGAVGFAFALGFAPAPCFASKSFVTKLENVWGVSALPVKGQGCVLCHKSEIGGSGTATQPFGRTLVSKYQLGAGDLAALEAALEANKLNLDDSDRDGVSDYAEIVVDATNPNDPKDRRVPQGSGGEGGGPDGVAGASCLIAEPETFPELRYGYGCGFASGSSSSAFWAIGLGAAAWVFSRRRPARSRR